MPASLDSGTWNTIELELMQSRSLILSGQYREAVVLNREILARIVRLKLNEAVLVSQDLASDIGQLFANRLIDAGTRQNMQRISALADLASSGQPVGQQEANDSFSRLLSAARTALAGSKDPSSNVTEVERAEAYEDEQRAQAAEFNGVSQPAQNVRNAQAAYNASGVEPAFNARGSQTSAYAYSNDLSTGNSYGSAAGRRSAPRPSGRSTDYVQSTPAAHDSRAAQTAHDNNSAESPFNSRAAQTVDTTRSSSTPRVSSSSYGGAFQSGIDIPVFGSGSASERQGAQRRRSSSGSAARQRTGRNSKAAHSNRSSNHPRRNSAGRNSGHSSGRRPEEPIEINVYTVLRVVIPLVCLLLVIALISVIRHNSAPAETTAASTAAAESSIAETTVEETTTVPETTLPQMRYTTTDGVRVRTQPSTDNSEVLNVLDPGTELDVIENTGNGWYKINYNGQEAYVSADYVKAEEIQPSSAADSSSAGNEEASGSNPLTDNTASSTVAASQSQSAKETVASSVDSNGTTVIGAP